MTKHLHLVLLAVIGGSLWATTVAHAVDMPKVEVPDLAPKLSADRLDILDRRGYFTPAFKKAVHDLVDAKQMVVDKKAEEKKLNDEVPALEKQVQELEAKVADLHKQFDVLDHVDESDFATLKSKMTDPAAKLDEQAVIAQAYVWGYPSSPHQAEAQQDLAEVQKKIADNAKSAADAEAARVAAHALLVQRAQAKDLNENEWRDFLMSMSKEDILKFMGQPQQYSQDEWTYTGAWMQDPITSQKVGLDIKFNAGRVINVTEAPH